jgi:hypothetical protein
MEKIINAILFFLACAAGLLLFVIGIREIRKKAHSRYAMRFMLYLSIVVMALGSFTGCTKTGKQPPGQVWDHSTPQNAQVNLEKELAGHYNAMRNAFKGGADPAQLTQVETALREAQGKIDGLLARKALSPDLAQYLKNVMTVEKEKAFVRGGKTAQKDDEMARGAIKNIQDAEKILVPLNGGQRFDSFVASVMKDQVKDSFISLAPLPIEKRLEYGRIGRDDYRDMVSRVQDGLYLYYRRSLAQVPRVTSSPTVDKPINVAMYSAKPITGPIGEDPSRPVSKYAAIPFREQPRSSAEYAARPYDREPPLSYAKYAVQDLPQRPIPPYSVRPQPEPVYSVRPVPVPVQPGIVKPPALQAPQGLMSQLTGQLWIKLPGKNWQELNTSCSLTTSSVVENRGNEKGSFKLDGRTDVLLDGHEIQTGWEIDRGSNVPDDLLQP